MESSTNDDRADLASSSRPTKTHRTPRLSLDHNSSEKTPTTDDQNSIPLDSSCSTAQPTPQWSPYLDSATCTHSYPARTSQFLRHAPNRRSISLSSGRRRSSVLSALRAWSPVIMYGTTTLAFVVVIAFYKSELFQFLDNLSTWLRADENYGHAVLFFLIFLTTIPPIPLYSTLIVLSGYTFGILTGAVISYFAALTGAVVVFVASRTLFRDLIDPWLNSMTTIRRVVRAIEKRPQLLFLIRLAPYPYNVTNCLLATSSALTLRTYTICTALSLFKVVIHTYIGASIHSFKDYASNARARGRGRTADRMAEFWTIIGISLCVFILVYISIIARRAIDEELEDTPMTARETEETRSFLASTDDLESAGVSGGHGMTEIPCR